MLLTGLDILRAMHRKEINITPFDVDNCGPNSYDLQLDDRLATYRDLRLDMRKKPQIEEHIIPPEGFVLQPGQLYLGNTVETTRVGRYVPFIEGRSSVGRLGLAVHVSAGFGDIGFEGQWTLELTVVRALRVYPNVRICQIVFARSSEHVEAEDDGVDIRLKYGLTDESRCLGYQGKYQGQTGPVASRLFQDFEEPPCLTTSTSTS